MKRVDFKSVSIKQISERRKKYNVEPVYQRQGGLWTGPKKRKLFDSFLSGFGIPKIYLRQMGDGKYHVIDGKQRIETVCEIFDGKIKNSNGQTYKQLSETEKDIMDEASFEVEFMDASNSDARDWFDILNSNGVPLNTNEKNHANSDLPHHKIMVELANHDLIEIFGISPKRYKSESWVAQCAALAWMKKTNTLYDKIGDKFKFAGLENKLDKEELQKTITKIFDAIVSSMKDDGKTVIEYMSNPLGVEIFYIYMEMFYRFKDINWNLIDGKDIIEKFYEAREDYRPKDSDYAVAMKGAMTGKDAITRRMEFAKKFLNNYIIPKYNLSSKEGVYA